MENPPEITRKENLLRAINRRLPLWVPNGLEDVVMVYPPFRERPAFAGEDAFGVRWEFEPDTQGGTYPAAGDPLVTNLEKWREQIQIPDIDRMNWEVITEGFDGQQLDLTSVDRDKRLICGIVEMGLFERSYLLLGMENALVSYLAEPELMMDLLNSIADFKIMMIERFHAAIHLDMIWYGDDWGTQRNTFLSPKTWRRIVRPATERIYAAIQSKGIILIQHSCGKISPIFNDLVEMGADVWHPCQPCNDLAQLKRDYGQQITFWGGIDSQFVLDRPGVTTEEVRSEVRLRIDEMAKGGGYIAGPSHSVPYDPDLLFAMNDEISQYGRAFYHQT